MQTTQMIYIDKYQFVCSKKYLTLKGPIYFETVHDRMYPLIKYGQKLKVEKLSDLPKRGDLVVAWSEEEQMLYFGIFLTSDKQSKSERLQLYFTKNKEIKNFPERYLLGRVTNIKISLWEKIKVLRLKG